MSETKTKNLCTVPAADLTDSQYFIAEDGGELKRIPKAQVVLKKLEDMLATDTENLAGGGEVTAQELLDALAEQVANKLLAKSQVVNNLLATVEGNPLDATQGKALKELIDTTNNNLSNSRKIVQVTTDDHGFSLGYDADNGLYTLVDLTRFYLVSKSDLFAYNWITNPNTCTTQFAVVNGWSPDFANAPDDARNTWNSLQTTWVYPSEIGDLSKQRLQTLITGKNTIHTRMYESGKFSNWS